MELFFCDQCERRIDSKDVAQAKAQAEANSGRMLCATCRPKSATAARSTARMERPSSSTNASVRTESGASRKAIPVPVAASARIHIPDARAESFNQSANFKLKLGIIAGAACLMCGAAFALFSGNGSRAAEGKKDVAQSQTTPPPHPQTSTKGPETPEAHVQPVKTPPVTKVEPPPPPPTPPPPPPSRNENLTKTHAATGAGFMTAAATDLPLLNVTYFKGEPPTIDGNLDDVAWKEAAVVDATKLEMGGTAKQKMRLFLTRNDTTLFIGVQCFEDEAALKSLKTTVTSNGVDQIWEDDSVELFLDPTNRRKQYYHIIVNSKGYHWDVFDTSPSVFDKSWKSQTVVAAKVGKDSWSIEVAIPFASLDRSDIFDAEWAFNVLHTRTAANELIYWSPVLNKSSHRPERFGRLNGMPKK